MSNDVKVYALCPNNCKFETMTKEQIVSMLQQLIETGSLADVDAMKDLTVAAIKETHAGQDIKFWVGTEAEYNAIKPTVAAGFVMARIDENGAVYLCTDDSTMQGWHDSTVAEARAAAAEVLAEVLGHVARKDNPHGVTAAQVGARPNTWMPTASDVGALPVEIEGMQELTSPTQLTKATRYRFNTFNASINDDVQNGRTMTDYTVGDFQCELLSVDVDENGCRFGTLLCTSPRLDGTLWITQIWGYKFYGWRKVAFADSVYGEHNITCGTADVAASGAPTVNGCIYQQYE